MVINYIILMCMSDLHIATKDFDIPRLYITDPNIIAIQRDLLYINSLSLSNIKLIYEGRKLYS